MLNADVAFESLWRVLRASFDGRATIAYARLIRCEQCAVSHADEPKPGATTVVGFAVTAAQRRPLHRPTAPPAARRGGAARRQRAQGQPGAGDREAEADQQAGALAVRVADRCVATQTGPDRHGDLLAG